MKKITALLLVFSLIVGLAACASNPGISGNHSAPAVESTVATDATRPSETVTVPSSTPAVPSEVPTVPSDTSAPSTAPTAPATDPTAAPTAPTTQPTVPPTEPTAPTTQPTVPPTEPTAPTTQPTVPPTEPTAPTTQPTVPPTEHTHSWNAATCTAPKTCKTCGATEGAVLGHTWDNGVTVNPPTETVEGTRRYTCMTCGANKTESIPCLEHTHNYSARVTAPGCTSGGFTTYLCACGDSYTANTTPALGHNWNEATCTAPQTCSVCRSTQGDPLGHAWVNATCTAPKTCGTCGTATGSAAGHSWNAATCTAPKTCRTCGTTTGSIASHSWNAATCTAPKTCRTCGTTTGSIASHSWNAATCTAPKTCGTCGTTEGSPLGHTWDDGEVTWRPTCKDPGEKIFTCTVCGHFYYTDIPATGIHTYNRQMTARPTATQTGLYTFTCRYCGSSYTQEIPKDTTVISACGDPYYIRTSNDSKNYVAFSLNGTKLRIEGTLQIEGLTQLLFRCSEIAFSGDHVFTAATGTPFSAEFDISAITQQASLDLYVATDTSGSFTSYVWDEIYVKPQDGQYVFVHSPVAENNLAAAQHWLNPQDYLATDEYGLEVTDQIRALAAQIVGSETDTYRKLYLLNEWVAQNIYYDYDYLYGKTSTLYYTPEEVYTHRYTVCEGYSRLLIALCRAQNIPALQVVTYSGKLNDSNYNTQGYNHAHVEAYLAEENRWVIMDPTWDSGNSYENGAFIKNDRAIHYFDISLDLFSFTHRIMRRGDWVSTQFS